MYLKRLEIQGFKSFAHQTVLEFLPPKNGSFSITAIVGPNGAGKSNIADAIRWVMGEQAMKNVRAKKNEDVIFNGSETKGALGAASVTMVLDNADSAGLGSTDAGGSTDVGLEFPEIVITRRLYRSGESEYLVNNNPARLLDIHLLLARAQFAEHAYSIVSQGTIDRLLTVTPAERKDFFDEASGIKEHQIKQHQAELKLARTALNVRQAETLLQEVEPRLRLLARQVKKLEKRQEVEAELRVSAESYYAILYTRNKQELDSLQEKLAKIDADYREHFTALEAVQTELADLSRAATRQESFDELQRQHQEAVRTGNEMERRLAIIDGQLQAGYTKAGAQNVGWLKNKAAEVGGNYERTRQELARLEAEQSSRERAVSDQRKKIDALSVEDTEGKLRVSRLSAQLIKNQSEQTYFNYSGLSAVKAVLENGRRFGTVHGIVAELGRVEDRLSLALEVAAGNHLSSVVVENENVARLAIEYLRENRLGVATFLPLNKIQPRSSSGEADRLLNEPGVIGKAIELVSFDPRFSSIFSLALGDTLVVEDLAVAERIGIGRARYVTLAGDLIEQKGIMRGGFRNRRGLGFSSNVSLGAEGAGRLEQELAEENQQLQDIARGLDAAKTKLVELSVASQSAAQKVQLLAAEAEAKEKELASLHHELALCEATPEEFSLELKRLAEEKKEVEKNIEASRKASAVVGKEIARFNDEEEKKKQRVFALQKTMQEAQEAVNAVLTQRNDVKIELAKIETKQEDLSEEARGELKAGLASVVERIAVTAEMLAAEYIAELGQTMQKLKYQLSLIGGIDEEVVKEHKTTKERYDFLTGQLSDLTAATADLEKMIAELSELMKKKRDVSFKKIRKDFERYFKILFGGGSAGLEEVYGEVAEEGDVDGQTAEPASQPVNAAEMPEDIPSRKKEKILTGIDVIANPPGKKVRYLTMLSGGERTLTSIALICAILYNNPSPFVVLDEVEAALDEANTLRFAKIMAELSTHSQFIIVTHNRVTMHAAQALYGVVMGPDGISKLLSIKMADVPAYEEKTNTGS